MRPTAELLEDLGLCRRFEYLRTKHNFFKMLVRKYGFLFWQFPSFEKGSFVELECEIRFEKTVRFGDAWLQLKSMWKKHMWPFLSDYKKNKSRRVSFDSLEKLSQDIDQDGKGFRFFRRLKGVCGRKPGEMKFEEMRRRMEHPKRPVLVKSASPSWDNNIGQFIFNISPTKSGHSIQQRGAQMSFISGNEYWMSHFEFNKFWICRIFENFDEFKFELGVIKETGHNQTLTLSRVSMLKSMERLPGHSRVVSRLNSSRHSLITLDKTHENLLESRVIKEATEEAPEDEPEDLRYTTVSNSKVHLHSIRCKRFCSKKHHVEPEIVEVAKTPVRDKRVSIMAALNFKNRIANALRNKLKLIINQELPRSFVDVLRKSISEKKELVPIVEEFGEHVTMILEHYYGEEELFEYDSDEIRRIRNSINDVKQIMLDRIDRLSTEKFAATDLHGKLMMFRKITDIVLKSKSEDCPIVQDIKMAYFLRGPVIANVIEDLLRLSKKIRLTKTAQTNVEFVFERVYRKLEWFDLSHEAVKNIVTYLFELKMSSRRIVTTDTNECVLKVNLPATPNELVKGSYTTPKGDLYFGEWSRSELISGVWFLKSGEWYKGKFNGLKPHGIGYRKNLNETALKGEWVGGYFQKGYQRLNYGGDSWGELLDSDNSRTGVCIYSNIDPKLFENHRDKEDIQHTLETQGEPGLYIGEFKGEYRSGLGSMYYTNGEVYHGEWERDQPNGQGVYYEKNSKYCGSWLLGTYHGHGEKVYENGDHYIGEWQTGMMHGKGVLAKGSGKVRDGYWDRDKFVDSKKNFLSRTKKSIVGSTKQQKSMESSLILQAVFE